MKRQSVRVNGHEKASSAARVHPSVLVQRLVPISKMQPRFGHLLNVHPNYFSIVRGDHDRVMRVHTYQGRDQELDDLKPPAWPFFNINDNRKCMVCLRAKLLKSGFPIVKHANETGARSFQPGTRFGMIAHDELSSAGRCSQIVAACCWVQVLVLG